MKTDQQRLVEAYEQVSEGSGWGEGVKAAFGKGVATTKNAVVDMATAAKTAIKKAQHRRDLKKTFHELYGKKGTFTASDGTTYRTTAREFVAGKKAEDALKTAEMNKKVKDAWKEEHKGFVNTGKAAGKAAPYAAGGGAAVYGYNKFKDMVANGAEKVGSAVGQGVETVRSTAANLGNDIRGLKNDVAKAVKDAKDGLENFGSKTLKSVAGFVKDHPIATAATIAAVPVAISGIRALADKIGGEDDDEDETDECVESARCDESTPEEDAVAKMEARGCRYVGIDDGLIYFEYEGRPVAFQSWNEVMAAANA